MDQGGARGSGSAGFDMSRMTTASKILGVAGVLYLIDLFLPWNSVCLTFRGNQLGCSTALGIHGIGILNVLVVGVIVMMEIMLLANVNVDIGTPAVRSQVEGYLCFALLVLTVIRFLIKPSIRIGTMGWAFGAFVGVALAVVIAYGGYMRMQEAKLAPPPPGPGPAGGGEPGGGFTN